MPRVALAVCAVLGAAACGDDDGATRPVVTLFGTLSDADVDDVDAAFAEFEQRSGIDVRFVASSGFEDDLVDRLRRGDPPDLALLPQPGLLQRLVAEGYALPWEADLAAAATDGVDRTLVDLVTVGDRVFGSWYQLTVKSLVWYSPSELDERGIAVPSTWDDLERITADAAADASPPWCIGIRAAGATGWVATDWVEDLVLRFAGPDVYDGWVARDVRFADTPVVEAIGRFGDIVLDPQMVAGGNRAAVEIGVEDSARQFAAGSSCLFHRQASFLPRFLDEPATIEPDGDLWAFPLPPVDGRQAPLVVGGTVIARFRDDAAVDQVAAHLSTVEAGVARAELGGFLSARDGVSPAAYTNSFDRWLAELVRDAEVVRFDASDQMPPTVGVGTFWTGMASWLGGARLSSVADAIDESWPLIQPRIVIDDRTDTADAEVPGG